MSKQTSTVKISATVTAWMAQEMKRLVEGGLYANESEIIRAGLRELLVKDSEDDHFMPEIPWENPKFVQFIKREVTLAYDELSNDPSQGVRLDQVRAEFAQKSRGNI